MSSVIKIPKLNTDQLICYLDAANPISYTSDPTKWYNLAQPGYMSLIGTIPFSSNNYGSLNFNAPTNWGYQPLVVSNTSFTLIFWTYFTEFVFSSPHYVSSIVSLASGNAYGGTNNYQGYSKTFSSCISINEGANAIATVKENNFPVNTWYHYTTVYDGTATGNDNRLKIYINGIDRPCVYDANVPAKMFQLGFFLSIARNITVGSLPMYPNFTGQVPFLMIYNRALSSSEILDNYNLTKTRYI